MQNNRNYKHFLVFLIFLGFTSMAWSQEIEVEGKVVFLSKLPDPAKAPYADYYFSAILEIKSCSNKEYVGQKIVIFCSGIEERKYTSRGRMKLNDVINAKIVPYDQVDTDSMDAAMADEVTDFSLQCFYELTSK